MKTVTINVEGASQGQWSTFLLELNLMKKMWRSYGVHATLKAPSINKIIALGTTNNDKIRKNLKDGLPTVPTILDDEMQCNIFLKAKDLQTFSKLRDLKDNF